MKNASVTIRLGANHNEVVVDGKVFDRAAMTKQERGTFRRILVGAFARELGFTEIQPA